MAKKKTEAVSEVVEPVKNIVTLHRDESEPDLYVAVFDDGTTENKYIGDMTAINEAFAQDEWQDAANEVWKNA